ncbi:unnamed protein product, partial [marine sediment metagenome]
SYFEAPLDFLSTVEYINAQRVREVVEGLRKEEYPTDRSLGYKQALTDLLKELGL